MATFKEQYRITKTSGEAIGQFKAVTLETDDTVDVADTLGELILGVAQNDVAGAGEAVTVAISGVTLMEAGDTIVAGDVVTADADGNVIDINDSTSATTYHIGRALSAGSDGEIVSILLNIGTTFTDES